MKFFSRLKEQRLEKKLSTIFLIVIIVASIPGILASVVSVFSTISANHALSSYGFAQADVGKTMVYITDSRRCVGDLLSLTNATEVAQAETQLKEIVANYEKSSKIVKKNLLNEDFLLFFEYHFQYHIFLILVVLYQIDDLYLIKNYLFYILKFQF